MNFWDALDTTFFGILPGGPKPSEVQYRDTFLAPITDVALDASLLGSLYGIGAALNSATGGNTTSRSLSGALRPGGTEGQTVSPVVGAFSFIVPAPGSGKADLQLPILNSSGARVLGDVVRGGLRHLALPLGVGLGAYLLWEWF